MLHRDVGSPSNIRILTFNVAFFPQLNPVVDFLATMLATVTHQHQKDNLKKLRPNSERVVEIVKKIREVENLHIVVFQEVWDPTTAAYLASALRDKFPYIWSNIEGFSTCPVRIMLNGLMFFSNIEMLPLYFERFNNGLCIEEYVGSKGFAVAQFNLGNKILVVVGTHLTSNEGICRKIQDACFGTPEDRRSDQMQAIADCMGSVESALQRKYPDKEIMFILTGDFNVDLDNEFSRLAIDPESISSGVKVLQPGQYHLMSQFLPHLPENHVSRSIVPDEKLAQELSQAIKFQGTFDDATNAAEDKSLFDGILYRGDKRRATTHALTTRILELNKPTKVSDHRPILGELDLEVECVPPEFKMPVETKVIECRPRNKSWVEKAWTSLWGGKQRPDFTSVLSSPPESTAKLKLD